MILAMGDGRDPIWDGNSCGVLDFDGKKKGQNRKRKQ